MSYVCYLSYRATSFIDLQSKSLMPLLQSLARRCRQKGWEGFHGGGRVSLSCFEPPLGLGLSVLPQPVWNGCGVHLGLEWE